ncbi:hypothetical protein DVH05_005046 [Phytophthora capsici]|nr:hypothetical protein DVH05_005046 [Phytophthora capsici]
MPNLWLSALLVALTLGKFVTADEWDSQVDALMTNLSTVDIVGQMTQIASYWLVNDTYQLDEDAVREYATAHVGAYLSPPMIAYGEINGSWGWTTAEMRAFVTRVQQIAMEENGGHPILYGMDAVHGSALLTDTVFFGQQINGAASFKPRSGVRARPHHCA